jgi:hypothetical protein
LFGNVGNCPKQANGFFGLLGAKAVNNAVHQLQDAFVLLAVFVIVFNYVASRWFVFKK